MNKENIRKLLKSYRDKQGLKQDYVASKLGISKKAYSKIETGENGLRVDYIPVLCEVLDIPYFVLLQEWGVHLFLTEDEYYEQNPEYYVLYSDWLKTRCEFLQKFCDSCNRPFAYI